MTTLKFRTDNSIWHGPEIANEEDKWIFTLNKEELDELYHASDQLVELTTGDFISIELLDNIHHLRLPLIKAKINTFIEQLHNGIGFILWRGIPVEEWSRVRVFAAFLIIGKCMGNLRQQNAKGHVLGHVKDLGLASSNPNIRVYQTRERQTFHTDSCDVVGLLCLKTAKVGGLSSLVSCGTIYNEMLRTHPELLAELLKPVPTDKRGEVSEGTLPYYNIPVFNEFEGYLSVIYQRQYIDSSQRFPDAPRLSKKQIDALNLFDSLTDDSRLNFQMKLEPGDMQFVNNHSLLHDRTAFEDWDDPDRKRHLLRMWIATPNARPLPPVFAERFGTVTVGDRGGFNNFGVKSIAPIYV